VEVTYKTAAKLLRPAAICCSPDEVKACSARELLATTWRASASLPRRQFVAIRQQPSDEATLQPPAGGELVPE